MCEKCQIESSGKLSPPFTGRTYTLPCQKGQLLEMMVIHRLLSIWLSAETPKKSLSKEGLWSFKKQSILFFIGGGWIWSTKNKMKGSIAQYVTQLAIYIFYYCSSLYAKGDLFFNANKNFLKNNIYFRQSFSVLPLLLAHTDEFNKWFPTPCPISSCPWSCVCNTRLEN